MDTFGALSSEPGFDELLEDFLKFKAEHPEIQKLSDVHIVKLFPAVNWENKEEFALIFKLVAEAQARMFGELSKSANPMEYAFSAIKQLSVFKVIALLMQTRLQAERGELKPKDEVKVENLIH